MPARGTPPINIRLTEADKATIEALRVFHGLPSVASVVRFAIEAIRIDMEAEIRERTRKATLKARKKSKVTP